MDGRIFHIKQRLSRDLGHHWTVREMAEMVGLSARYLDKLFKSEIGVPPMKFLQQLRLEKARYLLENSFLQIKQIGLQTGLISASNFTRDFKARYGKAPSKYRRNVWSSTQSK
jgi:transcriptional regulator GlxA family with amidase domain